MTRWLVTAHLLAVASCNQIYNLDPTQLVDARPDGFVCQRGVPFRTGTLVPIDPAYRVESARFTRERSLAYLSLCLPPDLKSACDLYVSPFSTTTLEFNQFVKLAGVSDPLVYDAYAAIAPDGEHMIFGTERIGNVQLMAAAATHKSFDDPVLTPLVLVPDATHGNEPYILGDGRTLYFSARVDGNWSLYRTAGELSSLPLATHVTFDIDNTEVAAVVTDDELEIFFASNRRNPSLEFVLDIWTATRRTPTEAFGSPLLLEEVSTLGNSNDWPVWISPDGCELYYINRVDGIARLFVARR